MAIYHLHAKVISRASGRSSVAAAAYRAGEILMNDRDGLAHDYSYREDVIYNDILLPEHAPEEYADRSVLWNAVEKVEKHRRAQLAREYEIALPVELNREEQIKLIQEFVKENFVDKGMVADLCIHDGHQKYKSQNILSDKNFKHDNPHAHVMLTMRPINEDGSWGNKSQKMYRDNDGKRNYNPETKQYEKCSTIKTTNWDEKEFLVNARRDWAHKVNKELSLKNITRLIDHRTLKEQGIDRVPQIHLGAAHKMEARAVGSDRAIDYKEIQKINKLDRQIKDLENEKTKILKMADYQKDEKHLPEDKRQISDRDIPDRHDLATEKKVSISREDFKIIKDRINGAERLYNRINEYDHKIEKLHEDRKALPLFSGRQKQEIDRQIEEFTNKRGYAVSSLRNVYSMTPEETPHRINDMRNTLMKTEIRELETIKKGEREPAGKDKSRTDRTRSRSPEKKNTIDQKLEKLKKERDMKVLPKEVSRTPTKDISKSKNIDHER